MIYNLILLKKGINYRNVCEHTRAHYNYLRTSLIISFKIKSIFMHDIFYRDEIIYNSFKLSLCNIQMGFIKSGFSVLEK